MKCLISIVGLLGLVAAEKKGHNLVGIPREIVDHHSLVGPFISEWWQGGLPHWDFGGAAVVTDKYIRLSPDKQSRLGWLWNDQANYLESWEATLHFRIHSKRNPGADGLALWLAAEPYKYDSRNSQHTSENHLFGNKVGFSGLGIIFDTYDNDSQRDNPVVSVIQGHGKHDMQWEVENDLLNQASMRCVYEFRNTPKTEIVRSRIRYSHNRKVLQIYMAVGIEKKETYCGQILNLDLPTGYYFGLTSTTGHLADNHDVYGFTVTAETDDVQHEDEKIYGDKEKEEAQEKHEEHHQPLVPNDNVDPELLKDRVHAPDNAVPGMGDNAPTDVNAPPRAHH